MAAWNHLFSIFQEDGPYKHVGRACSYLMKAPPLSDGESAYHTEDFAWQVGEEDGLVTLGHLVRG